MEEAIRTRSHESGAANPAHETSKPVPPEQRPQSFAVLFVPNEPQVEPVMKRVIGPYVFEGGGAKSLNYQSLARDLGRATLEIPFNIPPYFALIARALGILEGVFCRCLQHTRGCWCGEFPRDFSPMGSTVFFCASVRGRRDDFSCKGSCDHKVEDFNGLMEVLILKASYVFLCRCRSASYRNRS